MSDFYLDKFLKTSDELIKMTIERDALRAKLEKAKEALRRIADTDRNDEGVYGQWADEALRELEDV